MATIFTDNFNTYTDGELVGQGYWTGATGYWVVEGSVIAEGEKGICCSVADAGWSVEKTGTPLTNGKVTFYVKLLGFPSSYFAFRIDSAAISPTYIDVRFDSSHNITLLGSTVVQSYSLSTWYAVEIEWRSTPDYRFRARVNGGSWSSWVSGYLSRTWTTGLTKIVIIKNSTGTDSYYLDYIAEEPLDPPTTTIINHPRILTNLTSGTFTFTSDISTGLFFDAFDDNYLDPTKWANGPYPALVEQDGHLEQPGYNIDPGVEYSVDEAGNLLFFNLIGREVVWKMFIDNATSGQAMFSLFSASLAIACQLWVGYNSWGWGYEGGGSTTFDIPVDGPVADKVYECKIKFISTTRVEWYIDNILVKTSDPAVPLTIEPALVVFSSNRGGKFNDFSLQSSTLDRARYETNLDSIGWEPVELFLDAFDDNYLDPNKWTSYGYSSLVEKNGHLETLTPTASGIVLAVNSSAPSDIYQTNLIGREVVWKMSSSMINETATAAMQMFTSGIEYQTGLMINSNHFYWYYLGPNSDIFDVDPPVLVNDQFYECKLKFVSTTQVEWWINNILVKTSDPAEPLTLEPAIITFQSMGYGKFNDFVFRYSTPTVNYTGLSDAEHNFKVRAVNQIGVSDPSPAEYNWTVDTINPSSTIIIHPTDPSLADVHFEFSSSETGSTFEIKLDDGDWEGIHFSDNFDDNSLDPNKWTSSIFPSLVEQNGHLEYDGGHNQLVIQVVLATSSSGVPFTPTVIGKEVIWKMSSYDVSWTGIMGSSFRVADFDHSTAVGLDIGNNQWQYVYELGYYTDFDVAPPTLVNNQVYECKIKFISTTCVEYYIDGVLVKTSNPAIPFTLDTPLYAFISCGYCKFNDFVVQDYNRDPLSTKKDYTDLSDGDHTFYVRATDPAGNTDPNPPSYTWHVDNSPYIDLNWTDTSANETQFRVERKEEVGGTWGLLGIVDADVTSYHDTDIISGVDYYYRVYAHNSAGNSTYSNEASGAVPT